MSARSGQPFTLLPFIKCLQSEIALPKDPHTVVDAIARAMSDLFGVMIAGRKEGAPGRRSLRNCPSSTQNFTFGTCCAAGLAVKYAVFCLYPAIPAQILFGNWSTNVL